MALEPCSGAYMFGGVFWYSRGPECPLSLAVSDRQYCNLSMGSVNVWPSLSAYSLTYYDVPTPASSCSVMTDGNE